MKTLSSALGNILYAGTYAFLAFAGRIAWDDRDWISFGAVCAGISCHTLAWFHSRETVRLRSEIRELREK